MSREPPEDRWSLPRVPVDFDAAAGGEHAREVPRDAAAGHMRERERSTAQVARDVEVELRRREQIGAVVVLYL